MTAFERRRCLADASIEMLLCFLLRKLVTQNTTAWWKKSYYQGLSSLGGCETARRWKTKVAVRGVQAVKRSLPSLVDGGVLTLTLLVSQALAAQKRDRIYRKTELVVVTVKA